MAMNFGDQKRALTAELKRDRDGSINANSLRGRISQARAAVGSLYANDLASGSPQQRARAQYLNSVGVSSAGTLRSLSGVDRVFRATAVARTQDIAATVVRDSLTEEQARVVAAHQNKIFFRLNLDAEGNPAATPVVGTEAFQDSREDGLNGGVFTFKHDTGRVIVGSPGFAKLTKSLSAGAQREVVAAGLILNGLNDAARDVLSGAISPARGRRILVEDYKVNVVSKSRQARGRVSAAIAAAGHPNAAQRRNALGVDAAGDLTYASAGERAPGQASRGRSYGDSLFRAERDPRGGEVCNPGLSYQDSGNLLNATALRTKLSKRKSKTGAGDEYTVCGLGSFGQDIQGPRVTRFLKNRMGVSSNDDINRYVTDAQRGDTNRIREYYDDLRTVGAQAGGSGWSRGGAVLGYDPRDINGQQSLANALARVNAGAGRRTAAARGAMLGGQSE